VRARGIGAKEPAQARVGQSPRVRGKFLGHRLPLYSAQL